METVSHELQDETIIIIFAELARFSKALEECGNELSSSECGRAGTRPGTKKDSTIADAVSL